MTCLRLAQIHGGASLPWLLEQPEHVVYRLAQVTRQLLDEMRNRAND